MVSYYGRRVASDSDAGTTFSGANQQGQIYKAMPENGWAYAVGFLGGKAVGQPNLTWRGGLFDVSGSSLNNRLEYTTSLTISNTATSGADGSQLQANLNNPVKLAAGVKYGIAWSVIGGTLLYGMRQASYDPTESQDYYFHYKSNGSSVPTDPYGATSSAYEGTKDGWIAYDANVGPTTTTGTMTPTGTITTATPHFIGDFDDANDVRGDKMKQFQIQVRRVSDDVSFWDSTQSATSGEQAANQFDATYGGTALVPGIQYEWRYRVSDQFGEWSSWSHTGSGWKTFTVNAGGSVSTAAGTPTGKQETQSPTPFTGVWSHGTPLSTNAVEVRIKQGSTIIRTSPTIAKTVANGATISVTWAETTFAALSWGQSLTYEIRGRDTGALWSDWSAGRAFSTDASPTKPEVIFPAGGQSVSALPLVQVLSTDIDDDVASGFAVSLRIKNAAGTVLFTRAMVRNVSTLVWEYQTTGTDLATFAVYKLDAVATDGTITSAYSTEQTFTYAQAPIITVTAPTASQVFTANTPTYTFSQNSTQVSYRVRVYEWVNNALGALAYDSGSVAAAAGSGVPVNHIQPSGYLHNSTTYRIIIESTNNLAQTGTHGGVTFSLSFTPPASPSNFVVAPIRVGNDVTASAIQLSWDEPAFASDKFDGAVVTRRLAGSAITDALILEVLPSTSQTVFTDYYPVSGVNYTFAVYFQVIQGTDPTESAPAEGDALVSLEHVVVNSVLDGTVRAGLRYGKPMVLDHEDEVLEVLPWGQAAPHVFVGDYDAQSLKGLFELNDDRYSTGRSDLADIKALRALRNVTCYRDQFGERIFGYMKMTETKGQRSSYAEIALAIQETDFVEGWAG